MCKELARTNALRLHKDEYHVADYSGSCAIATDLAIVVENKWIMLPRRLMLILGSVLNNKALQGNRTSCWIPC